MKKILTILTILLLFGCKSEYRKTIEKYSDGKISKEYLYPDKNDTLDYSIYEYFPNGKISFQGTVENGKFVGVKLNYYDNGSIKSIDSIINPCTLDYCCCDGKVLKYYRNGKLDQTFENRNGVANGMVTLYDNDSLGTLSETFNYKNDKKDGEYKSFYKSGKIYSLGAYKNDTLAGDIYYFKETGDTAKIFYNIKGKQTFPVKKWLANGQILYATFIDSTHKTALFRWTDKTGKEIKREVVNSNDNGKYILPD